MRTFTFRKEGTFMSKDFNGIYAPLIKEFVDMKRSLGFKYIGGEFVLLLFDRFTIERNETIIGVTKELSDVWCRERDNESNSYHYRRCYILGAFSSFLNKKGIRSYIPRTPPLRNVFVPHIFSIKEMERIFMVCDSMQSKNNDLRSSIFIMPALLRTLYGTGVRIGEALSLINKDVNLEERYFILRDTKNGKDKLVPFSSSLAEILKDYVAHRNKLPIIISDKTPFFVTLRGRVCNRDAIYRRFCKILVLADIPKDCIRVHDLRHTFAVHSLAKMAESGLDLYCSLPILSTYLGHQSLRATNNYVRLTSEMYPELIRKIDIISFDIFPKV